VVNRRMVVGGLLALGFSPRGERQVATSGPRRAPDGPGTGSPGDPPSWLWATLLDGSGRRLATKRVPYARDVVTVWPVWLRPAAAHLEISDGAYRAGWPVGVLFAGEGLFSFRLRCGWLMWPR